MAPRPTGTQLHWSTWTGGALVLAAWTFRNYVGLPWNDAIRHGWPLTFFRREGQSWSSSDPDYWGPFATAAVSFSTLGILINFVTGAVLISCTVIFLERWARAQPESPKLAIKGILAITAWIATGLVLFRDAPEMLHVWELTSICNTVLFFACGLAWYTLWTSVPN